MKKNIKKIIAASLVPVAMGGIAIGEFATSGASTLANTTVNANYVVVKAEKLNVRNGPGVDYKIFAVANRGQIVTGVVRNGWLHVTSGNYLGKWLSTKYLARSTAQAPGSEQSSSGTIFSNTPEYAVATNNLTIKNTPSNKSYTSGTVVKDSLVSGKDMGNGWVKIDSGMYNGKYAATSSLKTISNNKITSDNPSTPTLTLNEAESNLRKRIINIASTQYGKPYLWGVSNPNRGFDCSGLSSWVYRQVGISIPRTSYQQAPSSVRKTATTAKLGDLVFLYNRAGTVYHVGILLDSTNKIYWNAPAVGSYIKTGSYSYTNNVYYGSFIN